jgi:hypothetical protein
VEHVVEFFAAGTGSELFELLAEILHQVAEPRPSPVANANMAANRGDGNNLF